MPTGPPFLLLLPALPTLLQSDGPLFTGHLLLAFYWTFITVVAIKLFSVEGQNDGQIGGLWLGLPLN